jgi:hypothetical protein
MTTGPTPAFVLARVSGADGVGVAAFVRKEASALYRYGPHITGGLRAEQPPRRISASRRLRQEPALAADCRFDDAPAWSAACSRNGRARLSKHLARCGRAAATDVHLDAASSAVLNKPRVHFPHQRQPGGGLGEVRRGPGAASWSDAPSARASRYVAKGSRRRHRQSVRGGLIVVLGPLRVRSVCVSLRDVVAGGDQAQLGEHRGASGSSEPAYRAPVLGRPKTAIATAGGGRPGWLSSPQRRTAAYGASASHRLRRIVPCSSTPFSLTTPAA